MRLFLAADDQPTPIRGDAAVEHMHEGRLAGAIVTNDANAFAGAKREIGAVQGPDGAVGFFYTDEIDDSARVLHLLNSRALVWLGYFIFALIAATASA